MGPIGSAESPFIFNDAIICLTQSLTEAVNQLSSGLRRARDLIEELGRRENFYLNLAGDSLAVALRGRFSTTPISPMNCPAPTVPRTMRSPSSSRNISTTPLTRRKTWPGGSPSLKRTSPSVKCLRVIAEFSINYEWRNYRSRYVDRSEVRPLWTCEHCGYEIETPTLQVEATLKTKHALSASPIS
jgi:hypothetical protein